MSSFTDSILHLFCQILVGIQNTFKLNRTELELIVGRLFLLEVNISYGAYLTVDQISFYQTFACSDSFVIRADLCSLVSLILCFHIHFVDKLWCSRIDKRRNMSPTPHTVKVAYWERVA